MKKVETGFLKLYNVIILGLLSLIGITTSCEKLKPRVEYGTPHANFIVNGKIESAISNTPINNIKVLIRSDSSLTDIDGNYHLSIQEFPTDQTFQIKITDIDGALNGEYQDLDTIVEFKTPTFINGDGWYSGETTKEFDIKMNPKK